MSDTGQQTSEADMRLEHCLSRRLKALLTAEDGPPLRACVYARMQGYSDDKARRWIEAGELVAYRDGLRGHWMVTHREARRHALTMRPAVTAWNGGARMKANPSHKDR